MHPSSFIVVARFLKRVPVDKNRLVSVRQRRVLETGVRHSRPNSTKLLSDVLAAIFGISRHNRCEVLPNFRTGC